MYVCLYSVYAEKSARARENVFFSLSFLSLHLPFLFSAKFPLMTSTCTTPNRPSGRAVDICYSINHQFI